MTYDASTSTGRRTAGMLEGMAAKKAARMGRPPAGRIKVTVSLDPAHLLALRQEAFRRASEDVRARADVSGILRELVDAWMKRRG